MSVNGGESANSAPMEALVMSCDQDYQMNSEADCASNSNEDELQTQFKDYLKSLAALFFLKHTWNVKKYKQLSMGLYKVFRVSGKMP